jgi:hypothetical protein
MSDDRDWRLRLDLDAERDLDALVRRIRAEEHTGLGEDVVVTHDGSHLFAYAMNEAALYRAREVTEAVMRAERRTGTLRLGHWDEDRREWLQTYPPLAESDPKADLAIRDQAEEETRIVSCVIGRLIRKPFEKRAVEEAEVLGLSCEVIEHPHLLSTQAAFKLTGRSDAIDAFAQFLSREERATTRIDAGLIPFGLP